MNFLQLLKENKPSPETCFIWALIFGVSLIFFISGIIMLNKAESIDLQQYQIFGGSTSFEYNGQVIIEIDGNDLIIRFPDMERD